MEQAVFQGRGLTENLRCSRVGHHYTLKRDKHAMVWFAETKVKAKVLMMDENITGTIFTNLIYGRLLSWSKSASIINLLS